MSHFDYKIMTTLIENLLNKPHIDVDSTMQKSSPSKNEITFSGNGDYADTTNSTSSSMDVNFSTMTPTTVYSRDLRRRFRPKTVKKFDGSKKKSSPEGQNLNSNQIIKRLTSKTTILLQKNYWTLVNKTCQTTRSILNFINNYWKVVLALLIISILFVSVHFLVEKFGSSGDWSKAIIEMYRAAGPQYSGFFFNLYRFFALF